MSIKASVGVMRWRLLSSMYPRLVSLGSRGPIISFTFDDFPRSALTVGGQILKSFGARATYYAAPGLMNTSNHLGDLFQREDLESVLHDGHELASHTFSHVSCRFVSSTTFRRDVERGRKAIEELTGHCDFGNFSFPFGDVTLSAKKMLGQDFASSRGIWGGLNEPKIDLNLLRANSLYGDLNKFAQAQDLILENERRGGWLIFYSHDVSRASSRFGCTPELLDSTVSFASRRGARILTVAEVVTELVNVSAEAGQEPLALDARDGHNPFEENPT